MTRKPRARAWLPVSYDLDTVKALKSLSAGEASAEQQKLALDWIISTASGTYELSFRSDDDGGERETAFAEGRRFVGMQVVKLVNMAPKLVAAMRDAK